MPFDLDRIIDRAGYLATQQCIQPYAQQRRVSSAPATTSAAAAAAADTARTAGARKSSLGSLVSPWSTSSGGGSSNTNSSRRRSPSLYHHRPRPPAQQGYSPVDLFFTAPVGLPVRGAGGTPARPAREDSSSSLDQFVTAPVGDFSNTGSASAAAAAHLVVPQPQQKRGDGSRPGSSDTDDDWTFATASGGSGGTGTFSGLDTTVDLTPSPPPPSARTGKAARHTVAPRHLRQQPQPADQDPGPGHDRVSAVTLRVRDLRRTKRFYEQIFGAAACVYSFDDEKEDGTSARLRLNGGGLVVTLRESPPDARRGDGSGAGRGEVLLTVPVDDAGEVCRRLRSLSEEEGEEMEGWRSAEPINGPGGARVVTFSDPAGHCWRVVQDLEGP